MAAPTAGSGMKWVGRAIRRLEDPALVAGRGRFTGDLNAALWLRFIRSPVASGRIVGITAPEGARIYRAADLDGVQPIRPMLHKFNYQPIAQPILAADVVRFAGEPIAAVVASSPAEAEDIAEAVATEIADLPSVVDAQEALKPDAPCVHDNCPANVVVEGRFKTADFDATLAQAHKVVRVEVRSHRQNATPLEARAAHAAFDPASGRVTLTCTTQMPHVTRTAIADSLQFPESDLRVVAPDVGGGFGQKMSLPSEYVFLVWLARKLRGTIAWNEDRRENLIAAFHSRDQHVQLEGAFDAAGKLIALSADVVANIGAYSCFPTTCGVEPLMAKAAAAFDLGPDEIRRRNLIRKFPYTSATGLVFDEGSYIETLEQAVAYVDLKNFREQQRDARTRGRYRGIGFATFSERTGYGSPAFAARGMEITPGWETVEITMDPSGAVEARIGASPHGQGLRTTLAQIIADQVGVAPERVRIVHGDTDRTPYGWGTFASRSLVIAGGASLLAAQKIRKKLLTIASHVLEAATDDIVLENGHAKVLGTDRAAPIATLARAAYHQTHQFKGEITPGLSESADYDPPGTFSNACHVAIVEVDIETGRVAIEKFLAVEDAGRIINPLIADGQVHGGIAQGIGNALFEEIVYDQAGNVATATLADYTPPTARDIPPLELHHIESLAASSVTGAKGLGEGGTIGAPAAVLNAVNDALSPFGVSIDEIPATPQRIRAALRASEDRRRRTEDGGRTTDDG